MPVYTGLRVGLELQRAIRSAPHTAMYQAVLTTALVAAELRKFDLILASDVVYGVRLHRCTHDLSFQLVTEPLYGQSWQALASVVCILLLTILTKHG